MISATLYKQSNQEQKKKRSQNSDEEETPMHKKNKFNIVNFDEDYGDDSSDDEDGQEKKKGKNENKQQQQSVFAKLEQEEKIIQQQPVEITDFDKIDISDDDDDEYEEEENNNKQDDDAKEQKQQATSQFQLRSKMVGSLKLQKIDQSNDEIKEQDDENDKDAKSVTSSNNKSESSNQQDEPFAEPMAQFKINNKSQQSPSGNKVVEKDEQKSNSNDSSEFNIFSERSEVQSNQGKKINEDDDDDDNMLNLNEEAKALEKILPFGIINPYGKPKQIWDLIMIFLLVYTLLVLPVRLAFENDSSAMLPFDLTIDALFFLDIIVNFISAYEDERGIVIVDRKKIAINYLKGWFSIDLVSTIPVYLIIDLATDGEEQSFGNYNNILRFVRLPRIYKLAKVFRIFQLKKFESIEKFFFFLRLNKEYTLIMKFTIITLVVIHIAGCLWYFIGTLQDHDNWIIQFGLSEQDAFDQYIASIYFVLTVLATVGYGNITPVNNIEYIFTLIFTFFGVAFFAYVMGTLTFTFSKLSQKVTMIKEREIFFNELAHSYSLPFTTHEKLLMSVQSSIYSNSNLILELYQEENIFTELPPLVQGLVCEFLFKEIIDRIRFFQGKPRGFLRKMFLSLTPTFLNLGDAIYFKGEPAEYVYFVIRGRLATKCEDQKGKIRTLIHVEGSYFGESDIIVSRARGESAIAEQSSEVWKIDKDAFIKLLNEYEDVKMEVLDHTIKKEKNRKSTAKIVKNKNFLELVGKNKQEEVKITKYQLIVKIKEKLIQSLNELVKEKSEDMRDIFKNVNELDMFISKVQEYEKVKEKLKISLDGSTKESNNYYDQEVEESLLKGMKIQAHLQEIQEYL